MRTLHLPHCAIPQYIDRRVEVNPQCAENMEADKLLDRLGGYGRWQVSITTLHGLVWIALSVEYTLQFFMCKY